MKGGREGERRKKQTCHTVCAFYILFASTYTYETYVRACMRVRARACACVWVCSFKVPSIRIGKTRSIS